MSDPYRTLPLDTRQIGEISLFRFVSAGVCLICASWLAVSRPPAWAWIGVVGALFVAFFWVRRWARARTDLRAAETSRLDLRPDGFHVVTGVDVEATPWDHVVEVSADEERLAVRVDLHDHSDPIWVEPVYGGLGLYELEAAFREARQASPSYVA